MNMGNVQSEDNKKWQIRREMEAKEADFEQKRNAYFAGQCTDKQLTEDTTQPFYESMRLSRKRLEERNLTVDSLITVTRSCGICTRFPFNVPVTARWGKVTERTCCFLFSSSKSIAQPYTKRKKKRRNA